ncbi:MAG: hypothetical protein QOF29_3095 [bacterium]
MSELVAISYPDRQTAEVVRDILAELSTQRLIVLDDAVVVARDEKGTVKLEQSVRPGRTAAGRGALWGGAIGLLFLAPLLGAAVGAAGGGIAGSVTDLGIDDEFLKELGASLDPPRAALVLLVREATADKVLPQIREYGGRVLRTSLSEEAEAALRAGLDESAPVG